MKEEHYLIALESINHANYLESELRKYGHRVDMVETPGYLTNDYYVALNVNREALEAAYEKIIEINIERFRIYKHFTRDGKKTYKALIKNDEDYDKGFLNMFFDQEDRANQVDERKKRLIEAIDKIDIEEARKKKIVIAKDTIQEENDLRIDGNIKKTKVTKNSTSNNGKNEKENRKKLDPIKLIEGLYKLRKMKNRVN